MGSTYTEPNHTTQNSSAYKNNIDAGFNTVGEIGKQFNPEELPTATMQFRVLTGRVFDGSATTTQATQNSATITAPTSLSRIDRAVVDRQTGSLAVLTGTTATNPTAPTITVGSEPVAQISLTSGVSAITNDRITDERNLRHMGHSAPDGYIQHGAFDISPGTTASATTVDLDTGGKVAVGDFNGNEKLVSLASGNDKVDITTTGAGGLINSSSRATSTWYEIGVLAQKDGGSNPTMAAWTHTSGTDNTPTSETDLPGNYDLFRAMGSPGRTWWIRTDGSQNILGFRHSADGCYKWSDSALETFSDLFSSSSPDTTEDTIDISSQSPPVASHNHLSAYEMDNGSGGADFGSVSPESMADVRRNGMIFVRVEASGDAGNSGTIQNVRNQQIFHNIVNGNADFVAIRRITLFKAT